MTLFWHLAGLFNMCGVVYGSFLNIIGVALCIWMIHKEKIRN